MRVEIHRFFEQEKSPPIEMITYLFIGILRKPNCIVTFGDSATYPRVGGVHDVPRASPGIGIVRLLPRRGARSFWTAKDISTSFITIKDT